MAVVLSYEFFDSFKKNDTYDIDMACLVKYSFMEMAASQEVQAKDMSGY